MSFSSPGTSAQHGGNRSGPQAHQPVRALICGDGSQESFMSGEQRELTFRFLAEPTDVNFGGKVHGGVVMKWIDQVGYAAAVGWSGHYSVTVAVGGIRFVSPIRISDLVTVSAKLVYTGTSSMHFAVDVRARDPMGGAGRLCTHCIIVFVALDAAEGKPVQVPTWQPQAPEDRLLAEYALKVMELSKGIEETVAHYHEAALQKAAL
jgi:acyl-CoA hydrolase